VDDKLGLLEIA